jgi:hypothetical protein
MHLLEARNNTYKEKKSKCILTHIKLILRIYTVYICIYIHL